MRRSKAFTLVELLISLLIISTLLAFLVTGVSRYFNSLEYDLSVKQVVSDIEITRQLAETSSQTCRIEFNAGKNTYTIKKGGVIYNPCSVNAGVKFYGKSYFSFVPSGNTDVGGSGTLSIGGSSKMKSVIVSSRGRVRVE